MSEKNLALFPLQLPHQWKMAIGFPSLLLFLRVNKPVVSVSSAMPCDLWSSSRCPPVSWTQFFKCSLIRLGENRTPSEVPAKTYTPSCLSWRWVWHLPFFLTLGTSSNYHNFSHVIEYGLAILNDTSQLPPNTWIHAITSQGLTHVPMLTLKHLFTQSLT